MANPATKKRKIIVNIAASADGYIAKYFSSPASIAAPMFAAIFAIGLVFALVFHRSHNLWIVAVMHAFGNAYAVSALGRGR